MRPRSLLVLFAVVVGLLAFIWFVERDLPSTEERREAEKRIVDLEPDAVEEVVIELGERVVRLSRRAPGPADGGGADQAGSLWRLLEPLAARADTAAVEALLDGLSSLEKDRTLDDFDPAAVGLEPPRARIRLATADGDETLEVGSEVPASNKVIVRREGGDAAFVTAGAFWDDVDREAEAWRSKDVFAGGRDEIARVILSSGERRIVLARRGDDFWLESPVTDRAHESRASELVGDLVALRVESFVEAGTVAADELGLDPPRASIEIVPRDGEPFRLELGSAVASDGGGAAAGRRYARFDGQVVEIGDDLDESLARPAGEWQSDAWSGAEVWRIDRVMAADAEAGELTLERAAGDWKRGDETISYDPVSDLLYAVVEATGAEIVPARPEAWGDPRIELVFEGSDWSERLSLYATEDGGHAATAEGRDFAVLLSPETVADLLEKLAAVRQAEPVDEEPDDAG